MNKVFSFISKTLGSGYKSQKNRGQKIKKAQKRFGCDGKNRF